MDRMHGVVDWDGPTMARPSGSRPRAQLASAAAAHARSHGGTGAAGAMWGWFRSGVALASPWRRDARTRWRAAQRGGCCGGVSRACETIVRPLAARGRPTPRRAFDLFASLWLSRAPDACLLVSGRSAGSSLSVTPNSLEWPREFHPSQQLSTLPRRFRISASSEQQPWQAICVTC